MPVILKKKRTKKKSITPRHKGSGCYTQKSKDKKEGGQKEKGIMKGEKTLLDVVIALTLPHGGHTAEGNFEGVRKKQGDWGNQSGT